MKSTKKFSKLVLSAFLLCTLGACRKKSQSTDEPNKENTTQTVDNGNNNTNQTGDYGNTNQGNTGDNQGNTNQGNTGENNNGQGQEGNNNQGQEGNGNGENNQGQGGNENQGGEGNNNQGQGENNNGNNENGNQGENNGNQQGNNVLENATYPEYVQEYEDVPDTNSILEMPEPVVHDPIQQVIGATGGEMKDDDENLVINFPEGALDTSVNITATYVEDASIFSENVDPNFLGAVEFGPSGTTFDEPVEVKMNLIREPVNDEVGIFCYDEENDIWDYVGQGDVDDQTVSFEVTHFSYYKTLDLTPAMTSKFDALVRVALETGQSDSWILDSFIDYLINEEYVMDYYTQYEGYWYEPCGLHVSGNYFMDGKEGDPNALSKQVGESNMVGNKFGVCKVASETASYQEYLKQKNKPASERQEITSISFIIDYKMIKPEINLMPEKSILDKDETVEVAVQCHYSNPANHFPEFQNLPLGNYPLTLPYSLKKFAVDKTELVTDEYGSATFNVTALKEGAEFVKVQFYVPGPFGEFSAGYQKFICGGDYTFEGHITENRSGSYKILEKALIDEDANLVTIGTFDFSFEYDFKGAIICNEDGTYSGSIDFYNIQMTLNCTENVYDHTDYGDNYVTYTRIGFDLYEDNEPWMDFAFPVSFNFTAAVSDDFVCTLAAKSSLSFEVALIMVHERIHIRDTTFEDGIEKTREGDSEGSFIPFAIMILNSKNLLYPFELIDGEQSYSSSTFLDDFRQGLSADGSLNLSMSAEGVTFVEESNVTCSTEMEITVVDHTADLND